jgi:putative hydrolase of the HAD superfamily
LLLEKHNRLIRKYYIFPIAKNIELISYRPLINPAGGKMSKRRIGAVTFDLWDCLFIDDSDEPKRATAGLPTKSVARRELVHTALNSHAPIDRGIVDLAYNTTDAAFRKVWHDQHVTWTVAERLGVLLSGLGRKLPESEFAELVLKHEEMELEYSPDPVPGGLNALKALHGKYPLIVVSDAIFSPGRALRELLRGMGLLEFFSGFVFSDEMGWSKPAPQVFHAAAKMANCDVADIVHIGDRPHNDIGGPHAVGARGVLLTVAKNRPLEDHAPDAICDDYAKLPGILEAMEK